MLSAKRGARPIEHCENVDELSAETLPFEMKIFPERYARGPTHALIHDLSISSEYGSYISFILLLIAGNGYR